MILLPKVNLLIIANMRRHFYRGCSEFLSTLFVESLYLPKESHLDRPKSASRSYEHNVVDVFIEILNKE